MKVAPKKLPVEERAEQETPAEMVAELMSAVRGKFYGDLPPEKWFKDKAFLLQQVVLWPASWLNERGLTLPASRYRQIVIEKINDSVRNARGPITNPTGWLRKCLQDHFRHNEQALHDEAKTFTANVERALATARSAPQADAVAALATAAAVIEPKRRRQGEATGQGKLLFILAAALLQSLCSNPAETLKTGSNQSQSALIQSKVGSDGHSCQKAQYSGPFRQNPA